MADEAKSVELPRKLRFAIMCSGDELPSALARTVEELLSIQGLELVLLIVDPSIPIPSTAWQKAKTILSFNGLWALHERSLRHLACYRPVDMSQTFASVPRVNCSTIRQAMLGEYFRLEDVAIIRGYDLDFILRLAFGRICGDILNAARYGVWSFHYGDKTKSFARPPAFWEIYRNDSVTGGILERLTDCMDESVILQKCFIQTNMCSYGQNLNAIAWATTYMPARVCRDILTGSAQYLDAPPNCVDKVPSFRRPNDIQMIRLFCKMATTWLKQQFESTLFSENWNVGVVLQPIHCFLDPNFGPQVEWLSYNKANHYIADPFVLKIGTKLKLLVEEFDWHSMRGYIVETELNKSAPFTPHFKKALDEGVHLSYPYLFECEGRYYCTPETSQKGSVCLYMFDNEREVWSPVATLIEGFAAVDPTPFQHAGRWWLFCTNLDDEVQSKLFLWHSQNLLGPWEPHPGNPVKMDVRSSRPAGRPFVFEGRLYRPAQDSSLTYGGGITINCVTCLTTQKFSEKPIAHLTPIMNSSYRSGIHTLNSYDSITVIDGKGLVFAPAFFWQRITGKLRKLVGQN